MNVGDRVIYGDYRSLVVATVTKVAPQTCQLTRTDEDRAVTDKWAYIGKRTRRDACVPYTPEKWAELHGLLEQQSAAEEAMYAIRRKIKQVLTGETP